MSYRIIHTFTVVETETYAPAFSACLAVDKGIGSTVEARSYCHIVIASDGKAVIARVLPDLSCVHTSDRHVRC